MRWVATWGIDPETQRHYDAYAGINPLISSGWFVDVDDPFTGEIFIGEGVLLQPLLP
jgi:hypothetical protein